MKKLLLLLTLITGFSYADCRKQETEFDTLACTIYFEAGNQDFHGMELVGHTILNRVKSVGFKDSIKTVVTTPNQYTKTKRKVLYKREFGIANLVAAKLLLLDFIDRRDHTDLLWFHTVALNKGCRFGKYKLTYKNHVFCG